MGRMMSDKQLNALVASMDRVLQENGELKNNVVALQQQNIMFRQELDQLKQYAYSHMGRGNGSTEH